MFGYKASPSAQAFMDARAFGKVIMGPVGGGKSTAALFELLRRAIEDGIIPPVQRRN